MKTSYLVIGSGQCGTRLARNFCNEYSVSNLLMFNTAKDNPDIKKVVLLRNQTGSLEGSSRNPLVVMEKIIPENSSEIKHRVKDKIKSGKIEYVIMFNSLGGGTGSALNYHILKNILIPFKIEKGLKLYSVIVFGFEKEKYPIETNQIAMLEYYYQLSGNVTIMPFQNDLVFKKDSQSTYGKTNNAICESVHLALDFDYFSGTPKINGTNTLDKGEFYRMTSPGNGFLVHASTKDVSLNKIQNDDDEFKIKSSKSIIVMFKTPKDKSANIESVLTKVNRMFPNQRRIIAESESVNGRRSVEILANGIPVPASFKHKYKKVMSELQKMVKKEEVDKEKNKSIVKTNTGMSKKQIFNI